MDHHPRRDDFVFSVQHTLTHVPPIIARPAKSDNVERRRMTLTGWRLAHSRCYHAACVRERAHVRRHEEEGLSSQMAKFVVEVLPLTNVEPHPNADRLDLAVVGNYRVIVQKDAYRPNDLVAYIPEGAVLPDALIDELGVRPYLAGSRHDRVMATKLRGVLSQGLVVRARSHWQAGQDVTDELGVTKWEPEIPAGMAGNPAPAPIWWRSYDVEPYNRYPHLLADGEPVYVTEKIHGTCAMIGAFEGEHFVSSKGLSDRHLVLKPDENNLYWRAALKYDVHRRIEERWGSSHQVLVYAEVYGAQFPNGSKIQDLAYNAGLGLRLAIFDVRLDGEFLAYTEALDAARAMELPFVPMLYEGPFERERVLALASGRESVSGTQAHIREGIVIRPQTPRDDEELGRVVLKYVSGEYLTRKGERTEYT